MMFLVSIMTQGDVFGQRDLCYHVPGAPPTLVSISTERPLLSTTETDVCRTQILNVTGETFPLTVA